MTTQEWLEKTMADRPPLTPAQVSALRPVLAPAIPHMRDAAPAQTGTAPGPASPHTRKESSNGQP